MKVANTGAAGASVVRRRESLRKSDSGNFAASLNTARGPAGAGSVAPPSPLDGLLSIQEVSDEPERRRRAKARGELLLSHLEEIRLALLAGAVPPGTLNGLLSTVREQRDQVADPRLSEILSEIELRAAVELAKLGQKF